MTTFFFHIPKTAGTSFKRVLERCFRHARDIDIPRAEAAKLMPAEDDDRCISGHFGGRLFGSPSSLIDKYPMIVSNPSAKVVCLLREPFEQAVSYYFHERELTGLQKVPESVEEFLEKPHAYLQSECLGLRTMNDLNSLLSSIWFWGISEDLEATTKALAERMGADVEQPPRLNVGRRKKDLDPLVLREHRARFEKTFELDMELYHRVRDALLNPSRTGLKWRPETQFLFGPKAQRNQETVAARDDGLHGVVEIAGVLLHDRNWRPRGVFSADEDVGISMFCVIREAAVGIEPALVIEAGGRVVFSAAFTPATPLDRPLSGDFVATAWVPRNMLNLGSFDVGASLSIPNPVRRVASLQRAASFAIDEARGPRSAAGSWKTPFPGYLRPLLDWEVAAPSSWAKEVLQLESQDDEDS